MRRIRHLKALKNSKKIAYKTLSNIFHEVARRRTLADFNPQELANLAHALVIAGYSDNMTHGLLAKIGKTVYERNFNSFELQEICNLAWSFSVGKQFSLIYGWVIEGLSQLDYQLAMQDARQLYLTFLRKALDDKIWNKEKPNAFLRAYLNNEKFVQKILQEVNEEEAEKNIETSQFQKKVRRGLEKILPQGYCLEEEYYIKPYPVDFAIFKDMGNGKGKKLITLIEVNGPTHFMRNGKYNLVHEFKESLLASMGYAYMINIDYIEWDKLADLPEQESFLKKKLSKMVGLDNEYGIFVDEKMDTVTTPKVKVTKRQTESIEIKAKTEDLVKTPKAIIATRVKNNSLENKAGAAPIRIDNSVKKEEVASTVPTSRQKVEGITAVGETQRESLVSQEEEVEKTATIMESISFYARSMPALALYLIFFMLSINTLKNWNSGSK